MQRVSTTGPDLSRPANLQRGGALAARWRQLSQGLEDIRIFGMDVDEDIFADDHALDEAPAHFVAIAMLNGTVPIQDDGRISRLRLLVLAQFPDPIPHVSRAGLPPILPALRNISEVG